MFDIDQLKIKIEQFEARLSAVEDVAKENPGPAIKTMLLDHGARIYSLETAMTPLVSPHQVPYGTYGVWTEFGFLPQQPQPAMESVPSPMMDEEPLDE